MVPKDQQRAPERNFIDSPEPPGEELAVGGRQALRVTVPRAARPVDTRRAPPAPS